MNDHYTSTEWYYTYLIDKISFVMFTGYFQTKLMDCDPLIHSIETNIKVWWFVKVHAHCLCYKFKLIRTIGIAQQLDHFNVLIMYDNVLFMNINLFLAIFLFFTTACKALYYFKLINWFIWMILLQFWIIHRKNWN